MTGARNDGNTGVSIHAPAEGATIPFCLVAGRATVSIHAPAEGATALLGFEDMDQFQFQSTRPRRARPTVFAVTATPLEFQSTRPRRARRAPEIRLFCPGSFNPRARGGRDVRARGIYCAWTVSIHAPAEGATFRQALNPALEIRFNPRARGGRDLVPCPLNQATLRFNPRARGERDQLAFLAR